MRGPYSAASVPKVSAICSPRTLPTRVAALPTRIELVAAATAPMTTVGALPATPGLRWCSASQ